MNMYDYWHPVLRTQDFKNKPLSVNFCGKEIVLFRGEDGLIGAVEDRCPHRRMRLSKGKVQENRLVCPYHGWSYNRSGEGISPASPKLRPCVQAYEVIEGYGVIWVKNFSSNVELPELGGAGFHQLLALHYRIKAPLELVADNFAEIEHTCTTHAFLGHDLQGISAVSTTMEVADEVIRVINKGPQKRMPKLIEKLLGYKSGDLFVGDGKIYFSPVRSTINNYWVNESTQEKRPGEVQGTVVFNPVNEQETDMMMFLFVSSDLYKYKFVLKPAMSILLDYETKLDKRMIESIADKNTQLAGMKLGRFDQVLGPIRDRINRIYWGRK